MVQDPEVELFKKYLNLGLTPEVFIDSILPVALGARKCSFCFFDQIDKDSNQITKILKEFQKDFGISFKVFFLIKEGHPDFFFFKDKDVHLKLEKLNDYYLSLLDQKIDIRFDANFIGMVGDILGFPQCCIESFINGRVKNESSEGKAWSDISSSGAEVSCYFAMEFYPCSSHCVAAQKVGKSIEDAMGNRFWLFCWKLNRLCNLDRVMNPEMTWAPFSKVLNDRITRAL